MFKFIIFSQINELRFTPKLASINSPSPTYIPMYLYKIKISIWHNECDPGKYNWLRRRCGAHLQCANQRITRWITVQRNVGNLFATYSRPGSICDGEILNHRRWIRFWQILHDFIVSPGGSIDLQVQSVTNGAFFWFSTSKLLTIIAATVVLIVCGELKVPASEEIKFKSQVELCNSLPKWKID